VEQYGERLVTDALASWDGDHSTISVATKVGHFRCFNDAGQPVWDVDGSPERLRRDAKLSAEALRTDQIDLLYLHRPDPKVEYEGMVRTLAGILDDGLARTAGISNANPDQIRLAHSILGDRLVAVQNQFSPGFLSSRPELELCGELGLAFVAWSPLGGYRRPLDEDAFAAFQRIADARGISRAQVILAWELSKGPHVIPIPGSHRSQTILDSLRSVDVTLNDEELAQLP
jgi:pyridoxine 4-dehydrogenase